MYVAAMKYIPIPNEGTCPFLNVSSVLVAPNDPFYITIRSLDFGLESVRVRVLAVVPRWGGGGRGSEGLFRNLSYPTRHVLGKFEIASMWWSFL